MQIKFKKHWLLYPAKYILKKTKKDTLYSQGVDDGLVCSLYFAGA